ncbi:glycosyltransferase [Clostridium sp. NSJ-145]|uniref:glycosyltransferase n=1 Tax=Clostridium sp. NSJ-145 TaxID=2897777 RepID=UPI001E6406CF|nr:glycosyltransferase [Clostridium sp. NSJ-145]MCD2502355.1 glycosyltransferase [Clostridium sp. NSJ-145]
MKKILIINNVPFEMGGMSSVIVNYINNMNRNGMEITLVVNSRIEKNYEDSFLKDGIKIIKLRRNDRVISYMYDLYKIMKSEKFDVVHIHGNSSTMAFETLPAYINKIPKRIVHCHNISCEHEMLNKLLWPILKRTYTLALACSSEAGEWLFKNQEKFLVLNNALDLKKYEFDENIRKEVRVELGINDIYTIGHVGYFNNQKNHDKLFQIVSCLKNKINVQLLCISGDIEIPANIKELIRKYELEDNVKILLRRTDVDRLLQAMDFFVFPSKFEGLGLALIEAQASGLPCLASDKIPMEAGICKNLVQYLKLSNSEIEWAKNILSRGKVESRKQTSIEAIIRLREAGYDIITEAEQLRNIYVE